MLIQLLQKFLFVFGFTLAVFVAVSSSPATAVQSQENAAVDTVPRNRLMTDSELLQFIDLSDPKFNAVKTTTEKGDTTAALEAFANYLRQRSAPRYFFDSGEIDVRVGQFAESYPEHAAKIKSDADEFIATYGADVDWQQPGADKLGRAHTPNTIRYLARQPKAKEIALSYYLHGKDEHYLEFLRRQVRDFVADYEAGKAESGRNDVFERFYAGHRTRNWLFAHRLLLGSESYTGQDQIYMLKVFLLHGARLIDVCKNFNWGNHQLHGLAGLYEMSIMYPELPVMRYWNREAQRVILEHIEKEIKPDGFQFERASHYFKLDIQNYFRISRISRLNGVELPPLFTERFRKTFDAIVALAMPNQRLPVLQDAQATYSAQQVNNSANDAQVASNDAAELADPTEDQYMSLGALLYDDPVYKSFGAEVFPAEFYWFFDRPTLAGYEKIAPKTPAAKSVALDDSKYFVMRSGHSPDHSKRSPDDFYMVIDAGLAQHKPDHTHGGVLGLIAYAHGEEMLPNCRVRYSDPSYRTMKNSLVKNVALVDNVLQGQIWQSNHARTGFGLWQRLPQPTVHDWLSGDRFDYFSGSHDAYDSLGVDYTRTILFIKSAGWLVIDTFKSDVVHNYQQIWQGEYDVDDQYNRAVSNQGSAAGLHILQADPARIEITSRQNFWTHSLQFEKRGVKNYAFMTLLYPQPKDALAQPNIRLFERENYRQVLVIDGARRHSIYFKKQPNFKLDEIETDAELVAVSYAADSLSAVMLHNGTRLEMAGLSLTAEEMISIEMLHTGGNEWKAKLLADSKQMIKLNGREIVRTNTKANK